MTNNSKTRLAWLTGVSEGNKAEVETLVKGYDVYDKDVGWPTMGWYRRMHHGRCVMTIGFSTEERCAAAILALNGHKIGEDTLELIPRPYAGEGFHFED